MKIHHYSTTDNPDGDRTDDKGFTLIEILIAIVLIGILSAVAVVGISNLVSKGTSSACGASKDAANAATAVYFGANARYPVTLTELTTAGASGAALTLPSGVTINGAASVAPAQPIGIAAGLQASSGTNWYLTMTAGAGGGSPSYSCLP